MTDGIHVNQAVELAARESYGRLIAFLAVRWRNLPAAEDALADAFLAALEAWPRTGIPSKPDAWLLTAARRRLIDESRRLRVRVKSLPDLLAMTEQAQQTAAIEPAVPDERLHMMFACAHPDIEANVRTPLMLQAVLGIDAARIASAFLVKPSAMGQRLSRAKAKIRETRNALELPAAEELPQRLDAVLEAVYAAYGSGWDDWTGSDPRRSGLSGEAIYLGRLLTKFLPGEPETHGLLALMLHLEARREARLDPEGGYVPLTEQDCSRWSEHMIAEAEQALIRASHDGRIGRFQLEAAIQSVHAGRARTGTTEWEAVALLYEGLVRVAPTIGARVGQAAAVAEARDAEHGLALLQAIPEAAVVDYQPYWALAGHLFKRLRRFEEADAAFGRAIGLCADPAVRAHLAKSAGRDQ